MPNTSLKSPKLRQSADITGRIRRCKLRKLPLKHRLSKPLGARLSQVFGKLLIELTLKHFFGTSRHESMPASPWSARNDLIICPKNVSPTNCVNCSRSASAFPLPF